MDTVKSLDSVIIHDPDKFLIIFYHFLHIRAQSMSFIKELNMVIRQLAKRLDGAAAYQEK